MCWICRVPPTPLSTEQEKRGFPIAQGKGICCTAKVCDMGLLNPGG